MSSGRPWMLGVTAAERPAAERERIVAATHDENLRRLEARS